MTSGVEQALLLQGEIWSLLGHKELIIKIIVMVPLVAL